MKNSMFELIFIMFIVFITFYTTSRFYINKYENIINKNNIVALEAENKIRKELAEKYKETSKEVNKLEYEYENNNTKIDSEFDNNSTFIISEWLFDNENRPQTDYSRLCSTSTNSCSPKKAESGIILSIKDVRDSLTLAKEADRTLNELNLCKSFIGKIYESNKQDN